jgi:NADPH:quinone reductase-like Zn-dependent oxidoreductase
VRQVWISKHGGPEVLEVRETADPEPRAGEVRIRVAASGINFADILARLGLYPDAPRPPVVVGYEVSGNIDRIGPGVDELDLGDRVVASTSFGGYSDVVIVPASSVFRIPAELSFEKAAAIPVNYVTAWVMLVWLGNVRRGERVLVHAAAGGVGQAALQICRFRGAEVIGTASASKHERLRTLGLQHAIDYRTQDFEAEVRRITGGHGVDIALDAVGGRSARKSYRSLAPLGRLFLFGVSSFAPGKRRNLLAIMKGLWNTPRFHPLEMIGRNRVVFGVNIGHLREKSSVLREILGEVLAHVADGTFDPVVDRTFPFAEASEAHAYIQARKNFGKVLLVP